MKKLMLAAMMILFATTANAQKDVTKFLGIPVDGTKAEMIQKLKAKGFTSTAYDCEILEGEFNGTEVYLHVVPNNNKVYRIMVVDKNGQSEGNIIIRFNKLCSQFENNKKYVSMAENQMISDDEDVSYEIIVHDKRYQAAFYQLSDGEVSANDVWNRQVWFMISKKFSDYVICMFYDNLNNQSNGEDL